MGEDEPYKYIDKCITAHVPRHEVEIATFRIGRERVCPLRALPQPPEVHNEHLVAEAVAFSGISRASRAPSRFTKRREMEFKSRPRHHPKRQRFHVDW